MLLAQFVRDRALAVTTRLLRDDGLREAGIRQVAVSLQLVEDLLHFRANGTARDQPFRQFSARVFASREQTNRRRLERRLHLDGKLDR